MTLNMIMMILTLMVVILAPALIVNGERRPPLPSLLRPPSLPPAPTNPPPKPSQQPAPISASQSCKNALGQFYNRTSACFDQIPPSPNSTVRSHWCSDSGCRSMLNDRIGAVLDSCRRSDAIQDILAPIQSRIQSMVQFMCPVQDSCPGNADLLGKISNQGPPTSTMLDLVCQPCALKNLGQQTREQMSNKNSSPNNRTAQVGQINQIAQSKAICDKKADGQYCSPLILGFNGSQPEQLCSPCFRKYFAKMAFTGNQTTDKLNPYQRFGQLLNGGCIQDGNNQPCIHRLAKLLNVSDPILANLSSGAPSRPLQQCASGCDQNCFKFLNTTVSKAGNCSAAIKPFVKFLGVDLPDSCFGNLTIRPPVYPKTIQKLTWVIQTNDTAQNICNQLILDMSTNFGMDPSRISCIPQQNRMFARRLLSNTQTVTTTSNDYSSDGSSSQSTFTPDSLNGDVVSVSDVTTTTTMTTMKRSTSSRMSASGSSSLNTTVNGLDVGATSFPSTSSHAPTSSSSSSYGSTAAPTPTSSSSSNQHTTILQAIPLISCIIITLMI